MPITGSSDTRSLGLALGAVVVLALLSLLVAALKKDNQ